MRRLAVACVVLALAAFLVGQTNSTSLPGAPPRDYVCPMDPDIRSAAPGKCPRCGMNLLLGIPEPVEYPLNLTVSPRAPNPGDRVDLTFKITDPKTGGAVSQFELVHEKLFHMFIVSQDLEFFVHGHPILSGAGTFSYGGILTKAGMYRVLADYYPANGTPQLTAKTIFVSGGGWRIPQRIPQPSPDMAAKHTANMDVELATEPARPLAGFKTMLFFRVKPGEGLEPYLGAWGHMLAASDDLIDLIHTHPFLADGGPQIQFNVIFPRARTYRLWAQFQRKGVVNTAVFTIPVDTLK